MRSVIFGFAMIVLFAGTSFAQENQEPAAWLAARQCKITPTEGPQLRAALQEFVDHARANPPSAELPGTVYGTFDSGCGATRTGPQCTKWQALPRMTNLSVPEESGFGRTRR